MISPLTLCYSPNITFRIRKKIDHHSMVPEKIERPKEGLAKIKKTRNGPPGNRGVQKEKEGTDSVSLEERKAAARSSCCAPDFITGRDASSQQVTLHIWYQLALTATVIASRSDKVNYPRCMRVFLMDQTHNAMLSIVKERDANVFVHHCQSPFLNYNTSHRRTAGGLGQWVGHSRRALAQP